MSEEMKKNAQALGNECIEHLKLESEVLSEFITISDAIRNTIGAQAESAVESLTAQHQAMEPRLQALNQRRLELKQKIGQLLQVDQPSIRKLERHLEPEQQSQISSMRSQVEQLAEQIRDLTLSNASLLQQSIDIYERLIVAAIGESNKPQTYLPSGHLSGNTTRVDTQHLNPGS